MKWPHQDRTGYLCLFYGYRNILGPESSHDSSMAI